MHQQAISQAVEQSELFFGCPLDPAELHVQSFRRGDEVSDRIDGEPCVGLIARGQLDVFGQDGVMISTLTVGDCFGVCNIFSPCELETRLRCRSSCLVAFVPKQALARLMREHPEVAVRYAAFCNRKIQFLLGKISLLTTQTCRAKLAHYLMSRQVAGRVTLTCSKERLAHTLGVSRAALFRELAALRREGQIAVDGSVITLLGTCRDDAPPRREP